ncbi:MAG: GDSL-type esterase/lipase family protein [Myxococcota bacterium]|nr:GDSL-type esterase/lipase family protein [Myxococcota bacterium]
MRRTRPGRAPWAFKLLAVLLSVECTLQVAGVGYRWWSENAQQSWVEGSDLTILCLGESNTWGLGAPSSMSYPRQLERFLQEDYPETSIRVVNGGVPGTNSWRILEALPSNLEKHQPDLVILQAGLNDYMLDQLGLESLVELNSGGWTRVALRLDSALSHLKLYRLVRVSFLYRVRTGRPTEPLPEQVDGAELQKTQAVSLPGTEPSALFPRGFAVVPEALRIFEEEPELAREFARRFPESGRSSIFHVLSADDPARDTPVQDMPPHDLPDHSDGDSAARDLTRDLMNLAEFFGEGGGQGPAWTVAIYERVGAETQPGTERLSPKLEERIAEARGPGGPYVRALEEVLRRAPGDLDARERLLDLLDTQNRTEGLGRMEKIVRDGLEYKPDWSGGHIQLAYLLSEQGRYDEAVEATRKAVETDPWNSRMQDRLVQTSDHRYFPRVLGTLRQAFLVNNDPLTLRRLGEFAPPEGRQRLLEDTLAEARARAPERDWSLHEEVIRLATGSGPSQGQLSKATIQQIIEALEQEGRRVILLNYPASMPDNPENLLLSQLADQFPRVVLSDASTALSERVLAPGSPLLGADGGHPSAEGYGLLARHLMKTMGTSGLLPTTGSPQGSTPAPR